MSHDATAPPPDARCVVSEAGALGLTFCVLEEGATPPAPHEFEMRIITDDPAVHLASVAASRDALRAALGGLELDDGLAVAGVGDAAPGQQYACRAADDGAPYALVIGQYSLSLFDKEVLQRRSGDPITTYSIGEILEWCASRVPLLLAQPPAHTTPAAPRPPAQNLSDSACCAQGCGP